LDIGKQDFSMKDQKLSRNTLGALILCGVVILVLPLFLGFLTSCNCGVIFAKAMFYAKLDDVSWGGELTYEVTAVIAGQTTVYSKVANAMLMESKVPDTSNPGMVSFGMKIETYKVRYISGGPPGSVFQGISVGGVYQSFENQDGSAEITYGSKWGGDDKQDRDAYFTFLFTKKGKIDVRATLDGAEWSGPVNYTVISAVMTTGTSAPNIFEKMTPGDYHISYQSGGPASSKFLNTTPVRATLDMNQTAVFAINFESTKKVDVEVKATLDGKPWTGPVEYEVAGPVFNPSTHAASVPWLQTQLKNGIYTVTYTSGGPPESKLKDITRVETYNPGGTDKTTLYINFELVPTIKIVATLDGQPWVGSVVCRGNWPNTEGAMWVYVTDTKSLPYSKTGFDQGISYSVEYRSGGPANAVFKRISPSGTQQMTGKQLTYTVEFISSGTISVGGTLDNAAWAGSCNYTLTGPVTLSGTALPQTFERAPLGNYTISYISGGPPNAKLTGITPSAVQAVVKAGKTNYTLEFTSSGSITVTGSMYSAKWEGASSYTIDGPVALSGTTVPFTFKDLPLGQYSITYLSGGPEGYEYHDITTSTSGVVPSSTLEISAANKAGKANIRFVMPQVVVVIPPPASADLSLTMIALDIGAGFNSNYTVTVTNSGPGTAAGVQVTVSMNYAGAGGFDIAYLSDVPSQGTYNSATGVWTVGDIANGATVTLVINVTTNPGASVINTYTNTAEITACGSADPDSIPNNAAPAEDDQATDTLNIL
jgi:hypothetical protein